MEYSEKYFNELKDTSDFKRLLELKKIIDDKYMKEINNFKRCEELYFESKNNKYYPGPIFNLIPYQLILGILKGLK